MKMRMKRVGNFSEQMEGLVDALNLLDKTIEEKKKEEFTVAQVPRISNNCWNMHYPKQWCEDCKVMGGDSVFPENK